MAIHIFDVDHTLVRQSTGRCFLSEGLKHRVIKFSQVAKLPFKFLLYKLSVFDPGFIEKELKVFAGLEYNFLLELSRKSFEKRVKKQIYKDARELISTLKEKGERILVATTSMDFLVEPLMDYLGIEEYIASRLEVKDGILTGNPLGKPLFSSEKKVAIEKFFDTNSLDFNEASFYSDSYHDLPLLSRVNRAIAVNPDPKLKKEAKLRGWQCLYFRELLKH